MTTAEAPTTPTWLNLVTGLLVLGGILGATLWGIRALEASAMGTSIDTGTTREIEVVDGEEVWRAIDDDGTVLFEGTPEQFARWDDGEARYQGRLRHQYLYPALALIAVGTAVWWAGSSRRPVRRTD